MTHATTDKGVSSVREFSAVFVSPETKEARM
jgi:hypothetical protein